MPPAPLMPIARCIQKPRWPMAWASTYFCAARARTVGPGRTDRLAAAGRYAGQATAGRRGGHRVAGRVAGPRLRILHASNRSGAICRILSVVADAAGLHEARVVGFGR